MRIAICSSMLAAIGLAAPILGARAVEPLKIAFSDETGTDHDALGAPFFVCDLVPGEAPIPSVRSLQAAFVRAGVHRPRRRRVPAAGPTRLHRSAAPASEF